jgi:hypothetical protein
MDDLTAQQGQGCFSFSVILLAFHSWSQGGCQCAKCHIWMWQYTKMAKREGKISPKVPLCISANISVPLTRIGHMSLSKKTLSKKPRVCSPEVELPENAATVNEAVRNQGGIGWTSRRSHEPGDVARQQRTCLACGSPGVQEISFLFFFWDRVTM